MYYVYELDLEPVLSTSGIDIPESLQTELHTYAKPFGPIDCTLLESPSQLCCDFAKPAFQFVVEVRLLFAERLEGRNWSLGTFANICALFLVKILACFPAHKI